jgi:eukaryotic-like serine/threonine-protein kinase
MQAQRWQQLSELFAELTTRPPHERAALIESSCPDDPELRRELASLLRAHDLTRGPLDQVLPYSAIDAEGIDPELVPGQMLGPYRLIQSVGEGGMGSVWLAERADGSLKRKVALKYPHRSWRGAFAARMAQERDILAALEHPNIARLYDAGVDAESRPYLAMEFVEGTPITQHAAEQGLTSRQRLELFVQVLDAVQYAHMRRVIHRDIKPSNILVSKDGRVSLLDFGVADLLEGPANALSDTQSFPAFTPDYASPEQIRGDPISTASDVYSLGVVAFELLTGARPYRLSGESRQALVDELARGVVKKPSEAAADASLRRALDGDVDAILAKAMRQVPDKRYVSAEAFRADILRHLNQEPVAARPDRLTYRLQKLIAKHRWPFVFASLALLAVLGGAAVALWQARDARREAARATDVKRFTLSLLESADTDSGSGSETTAAQLLLSAARRIDSELADRPEIAAELMATIGYGLLGQGRPKEAAELLTRAIDLSTRMHGVNDARTVRTRVILGEALAELGESKRAIDLLSADAVRAQRSGDWAAAADAWRWASKSHFDLGDAEAGLAAARASVAALPMALPNDRQSLLHALEAHAGLANVLALLQREGTIEAAQSALTIARRVPGGDKLPQALGARLLLGSGLVTAGRWREGIAEMRAAYAGFRSVLGESHPETATVANRLAFALISLGDVREALTAYQASNKPMLAHPERFGALDRAFGQYGVGLTMLMLEDYVGAEPYLQAAIQLFHEAAGESAPMTLRSRSLYALGLAKSGRVAQAEAEFAKLATAPFAGADEAAHAGRLAELRSLQGRHAEAVALAQASVDGLVDAPALPVRSTAVVRLGRILHAAGRDAEALTKLDAAVAALREQQPYRSPEHEAALALIAKLLAR